MSQRARPFPHILEPAFSARDFEASQSSIAVIDGLGEILWVNTAWRRFAADNGGHPGAHEHGSYFDGITLPLRDFYRGVFTDTLVKGTAYTQEYDCSSADAHRPYQLRALPINKQALVLEHSPVINTTQDGDGGAKILDSYRNADKLILQCSHCRRVHRTATQAWDWVPALVAQPLPRTSHGLCKLCAGFYWGRRRKP